MLEAPWICVYIDRRNVKWMAIFLWSNFFSSPHNIYYNLRK